MTGPMPDRDAIRARIKAFVTTLPDNIPQHAMAFIAAEFVSDCTALLAALDKAEEERARLKLSLMAMERLYGQDAAHLKAMCEEADALEARADAAERRGEDFQVALNEAIADERHTAGERAGLRMAGALFRARAARGKD